MNNEDRAVIEIRNILAMDWGNEHKLEAIANAVVNAGYADKDWVDQYIESVKELNHVPNQDSRH